MSESIYLGSIRAISGRKLRIPGCACLAGPELRRFGVLKVHTYANCDTCRRAVKWLRSHGLAFTEHPIRETPPTPAELRTMLAAQDGELRRLFNTSGRDYREQGLGEKFASLTQAEALALLARNGNLVKRPFLLGPGTGLVGFNEAAWAAALLKT